jgi:thioredoxin-related protein
MKKKTFAALAAFVIAATVQAQDVQFVTGHWNDAVQKAKAQNKLLFVDLYFEGCMPCKQMDLTTFKNKAVSEFVNANFVSYKTDVMKEDDGRQLAMRYAASGFPTYLFLNAEGKILDITSGYSGASNFLPLIKEVKNAALKSKTKNYTVGLNASLPQFYLDRYLNREVKTDSKAVIAFLDAQRDPGDEVPFLVMTSFGTNDKYNSYYFEHATELADKYSRMVVRNKLINIIKLRTKDHAAKQSVTDMAATLNNAKAVFTPKEWERFSKLFWEDYYKTARDYEGFAAYVNTSEQYDMVDKIYVTTATLLQTKDKPAVAKGLLKLYDENSRDFDQLYTAAWLHFYAGEKVTSRKLLEKAQAVGSKSEKEENFPSTFLAQLDQPGFQPAYLPRAKAMVME